MRSHLITTIGAILLLAVAITGTGCGKDLELNPDDIDVSNTQCTGTVAQILVMDGSLKNLCGCQEAAGTQPVAPSPLTCTVPAGTTVFFYYIGATLNHQIISVGRPTFVSSQVAVPNGSPPILVHAVTFSTSGNYDFQDSFNSTLNGSIQVL